MGILELIYRVILAVVCLLTLVNTLKEKSLTNVINMSIVSVPLVMRLFLIK